MKITIDRAVFARAISELAPLTKKKTAIAIFDSIKFVTKGNRIRLQSTDGEMTIRKYIEAQSIDVEDAFCVNGASLNAFISKVKGDTLEMTIEDDIMKIKHKGGVAELKTIPIDGFVEPEKLGDEIQEINIPSDKFARLLNVAKNFVSSETIRPQICSIFVRVKDKELTMCATDTRKMFVDKFVIDNLDSAIDTSFYITPNAFGDVLNACKGEGAICVKTTEKMVVYRIGPTTIFTLQPTGKYPNFERVIPQQHSIEVNLSKDDLSESLTRSAIFTEQSGLLKICVSNLSLDITAINYNNISKSVETLTCTANSGLEFGVNVVVFKSLIDACEDKDVNMLLGGAALPIVIKDSANQERILLCMPMSINA